MARPQRDAKRERVWRTHVERQRASGQAIRAYCRDHRLRESAFYFWRQEIAKRDRESVLSSSPAPAFVPVAVIDSPALQNTPIDIRLAGGIRVRVRAGCDRGLLAEVLALLHRSAEGRSC